MHHKRTNVMTVVLLGSLLTLGVTAGCAGETKTVKTVTVEQPATATLSSETQQPVAARRTETTTTTESDERSPGIIGSAFRLVWAVVSFPFRVVGDLV